MNNAPSRNPTIRVLDSDPRIDSIERDPRAPEQHLLAVLGVGVGADVRVDGSLAQGAQDGAVHLPPHGRAVRHVVLPVDVQPRMLPRDDLLVAERPLLGRVLEPLQLVRREELRR